MTRTRASDAVTRNIKFGNLDSSIIASQAQAQAGVATDKLMTPLRVKEAIAAQAIRYLGKVTRTMAFNENATFTNTVGVVPLFVVVELECLTAQGGFVTGDKFTWKMGVDYRGSTTQSGAQITAITASNITHTTQNIAPEMANKSATGIFSMTAANWQINYLLFG